MSTPATLSQTVQSLLTQFTTEKERIARSSKQDSSEGKIAELLRQQKTADVAFREAEAAAQASGYKSRRQTLQEFVLTFFFTAILVITITLMIRSYTQTQVWTNPLKIAGLSLFITACVWGILLRYA
jgi:hypothetical protein